MMMKKNQKKKKKKAAAVRQNGSFPLKMYQFLPLLGTFQIMKFKLLNENLIWELRSRAVLWGNIDSKLFEVFDLFIWICANTECLWNFNFL